MDENIKTPAPEMPMYEKTLAAAVGGMGVEVSNLAQQEATLAPVGYRPTITEQLGMRRAQLLAELANLDAAIAKAKEQSGAMGLLDAISKTNVGRNRDY